MPRAHGEGDIRALVLPTPDEVNAIFRSAPLRFRAAVALGAGCGMRLGEVLGLAIDRVRGDRNEVTIDRQLQRVEGALTVLPYTKTARGRRTIRVPGSVALELRRHLRDVDPGASGLLFTGRRGAWMRRDEFYRTAWRPALAEAGIERGLRFHDLRHFVVSGLVGEMVPVAEVAAFVGDSSETIRRTYEHAMVENRELPRLALDRIFAPAVAADATVSRLFGAQEGS